ncbi:MAG: anhydro-N-acetylmuramic acid kinase [Succinivibrio sp.]
MALYVGLMSGTSIDGIDAVLADICGNKSSIVDSYSVDFPSDLKELLHSLCIGTDNELEKAGYAAVQLANTEAMAVNGLLSRTKTDRKDVIAIGSHGQTVRHRPEKSFSIQIDDGARLAALTGIDVVNNFRAADLAHGGLGAPLTQAFHRHFLSSDECVSMVLNLGGIANLTVIDKDSSHSILQAFDTGPANTLIDTAMRLLLKKPFDKDGLVASSGKVIPELLAKYLDVPYLKAPPPKSTGRETFNVDFIAQELLICTQDPDFIKDFIATLTEFTVLCSVNAIRQCLFSSKIGRARLIVCGGGAYNSVMMKRFKKLLEPNNVEVMSAESMGISSKLIEAHAFAYFASLYINGIPLDLGKTTGAKQSSILGCLHKAIR